MTSNEIRSLWLKFFEERGHHVEPSSNLIPLNDPTLLWINSGVAALKKYFDGSVVPKYKRITNAQKSIRTNDIESVGYTARHHTFFEMLGCFSIGDYFKESIIPWAFELLTSDKYFCFDKDKIFVTYYPDDTETRDLWIKVGLAPDHVIPLEGNFWEIGAGPSGPNTEVFYDRGEKYDPKQVGIDLLRNDVENDRYIEIWGIVFSCFNANPDLPRSEYPLLPNKNVDTGAGFERFCLVVQEAETNFETDLFTPILAALQKLTDHPYSGNNLISYRIVMDHLRTLVFALSDGAVFEPNGRGYVLRRLLRRASIHGQKLAIKPPFLYSLVDSVVDNMSGFYPTIKDNRVKVMDSIRSEEERFAKTLVSGRENLIKVSGKEKKLDGSQLFTLFDTYGLPLDLSLDFAEELGIAVSTEGFNELLEEQKERARSARVSFDSMNAQSEDLLKFTGFSSFTYSRKHTDTTVIGLFKKGVQVQSLKEGEIGEVILQETNFYAESGGQAPDSGEIRGLSDETNIILKVTDVQKAPNGQHLHNVLVESGIVRVGDSVTSIVDRGLRLRTMRNHSATHLLQAALNAVLGTKVHQLGSFVDSERLRFDFSYPNKLSEEQLKKIEQLVNDYISSAFKGSISQTTLKKAVEQGAIAEFGDKYDKDNVRLVTFGQISKELCGGTHVENTQEIGVFFIESESGIAAGVRRIQATTSYSAYVKYLSHLEEEKILMNLVGSQSFTEAQDKLRSLLESYDKLRADNAILLDKISAQNAKSVESSMFNHNGVDFLIASLRGLTRETVVKVNDGIKAKYPNYCIVLVGDSEGNVNVIASSSETAIKNGYPANELMREIFTVIVGRGGGKDSFASGAGNDVNNIEKGIHHLKDYILQ